ncbi:hypothetical protein N2152v2_000734 [Parachlorella kessleri]
MSLGSQPQALLAAAVYSHLLVTAGCPVFSLFDRATCGAFLKLLRETASAPPRKAAGGGGKGGKKAAGSAASSPVASDAFTTDAMDVDGPNDDLGSDGEGVEGPSQRGSKAQQRSPAGVAALAEPLANLAALLARFGLRDQPDTVRSIAEAAAEVSRAPTVPAEAAEASYAVLAQLLQPTHGSVREVAAMVFRLLANNILGVGEGGKGPTVAAGTRQAAALRARVVQFAKDALKVSHESREAVAALARHVVLKAPDKAEFRAAAVEGAVALVLSLDAGEQQAFVGFVARLSRAPKVSQRQMAVELAPALLQSLEDPFAPVELPQPQAADGKTPAGANSKGNLLELSAVPWGAVCLAVLVQRCGDKSAAVRGRAMQQLACVVGEWTSFNGGNSREEVRFCAALSLAHEVKLQPQPLMADIPGLVSPAVVSPAATDEPGDTPMTLGDPTPHPRTGGRRREGARTAPTGRSSRGYSCFTVPAALLEAGEADLRSLLHLARKRCSDEKGQVRKAAVQLLEALLVMRSAGVQRTLPQPKDMAAIEAATSDALVSVRKAGLTAAHSLLKALPDQPAVAALWVRAALPLVRDVEASIQEAVLDQFQDLVTGRAVAAGACSREGGPTSSALKAAEELRPILAAFATGGGACKACVARACSKLKAKSRLRTKQAATGLQHIILGLGKPTNAFPHEAAAAADSVAGAWLLFAEVSTLDPAAPSWQFLQEQWDAITTHQENGGVGAPAAAVTADNAAQLLKVVAAAAAEFPAEQARQLTEQLLSTLRGFTLPPAAAAAHVAAVARLWGRHGAGEGSSKCGWAQELLTGAEKVLGDYVNSQQVGRAVEGMQGDDWRAAGALFTVGEVALLRLCKPSGRLVTLVQAMTASRLGPSHLGGSSQASQGLSQGLSQQVTASQAAILDGVAGMEAPGTVQAHSWVALGKLCLTDEALAKKCVPLFVQELGRAQQPAVRNNIMVALADLVINYTALVDSHVPRLAACIRDPNELVRTQALALLANLLQKDYVKWRGPLFHRFLLALIDDSTRVRALAEYLLGDTIATKLPNLAYNHFVEALFVLNDCQAGLHGGASSAAAISEGAGGGSFCLKGASPLVRAKRDAIYRALLVRMSPEHKFATAARLCQEVLGGAADGALPLDEGGEVLGDALRILACKEIKVTASKAGAEDPDADPAAAVGAAKGKLVSAMMKKHLVEGVVPVIIELKRAMEAARHPLLGDLMAATAAMLRDYKNEIEDILVADKQLAKEILYDMRQAEQQAKQQQQQAAASAQAQAARAGSATPQPSAAGGPGQGGLPSGTSAGTPLAAEVLLTARKAAAGAAAPGAQATGATPGAALPARTPGGRLLPGKTPGSGYKTPGVPHTTAKGQSGGANTVSRLARASGPIPSPQQAVPGSAGAAPLSAPRLRGTSGRTPAGASRLGPRAQDALAQQAAALAVSEGGPVAAASAAGEGEEEQQVQLPFVAPTGAGGSGVPPQGTASRQWNVSAEAAQLARSSNEGAAAVAGARAGRGRDAADRVKQEDAEMPDDAREGPGPTAGAAAGVPPSASKVAAVEGARKGRGRRRQGKEDVPLNAPAERGSGKGAGVAVKAEGKASGSSGPKARPSRKRKV